MEMCQISMLTSAKPNSSHDKLMLDPKRCSRLKRSCSVTMQKCSMVMLKGFIHKLAMWSSDTPKMKSQSHDCGHIQLNRDNVIEVFVSLVTSAPSCCLLGASPAEQVRLKSKPCRHMHRASPSYVWRQAEDQPQEGQSGASWTFKGVTQVTGTVTLGHHRSVCLNCYAPACASLKCLGSTLHLRTTYICMYIHCSPDSPESSSTLLFRSISDYETC